MIVNIAQMRDRGHLCVCIKNVIIRKKEGRKKYCTKIKEVKMKIKRLISTFVAGIMLITSFSVMNINVAFADTTTLEVGANKTYATVTAALEAATGGETISIDPGTYREQIRVTKNNISFVNSNPNGGDVLLTWYYGVGYAYSNCVNGFYSSSANIPASELTYLNGPDRWGASVQVTGNNFYAENITFENSFNRYVTQEEIAANAKPIGANYSNQATTISVERTSTLDAVAKSSTERAAALVLDNNQSELYNCKILGSQDTLYTKTGKYYFNNCTIQGQTDYIFGSTGTALFDDCNLIWAGYTTGSTNGWITAFQGGKAYFRNCTISGNSIQESGVSTTVTPGFLGRPWGDSSSTGGTSTVLFIDTAGINGTNINTSSTNQTCYFDNNGINNTTPAENMIGGYLSTDSDYAATPHTIATSISQQAITKSGTTITTDDILGENILGTFKPKNYAFAEDTSDPTTSIKWDFTTNTDVNIQNTTGTIKANDESTLLSVDASSNGKLASVTNNGTPYVQFNQNTILKIPVTSTRDEINIVSYSGQYNYKIGGTAADANSFSYTANLTDVGNGYVEVVATSTAYLYSIELVKHTSSNLYTWDFSNIDSDYNEVTLQGTSGSGSIKDTSGTYILAVDATNGKFQHRSSNNDVLATATTYIDVPVRAVGDEVTASVYYSSNITFGNQTSYLNGDGSEVLTYNALASDVATGYVRITVSDTTYFKYISLKTNGRADAEIATTEETTETTTAYYSDTAVWDFKNSNPQSVSTVIYNGTTGTVDSTAKGVALYVDATNGKFDVKNRGTDAQFNENTVLQIPVHSIKDSITIVGNYSISYTIDDGDTTITNLTNTFNPSETAVSNGYVKITSKGNSYIYSITLNMYNPFSLDSVVPATDGVYVIGKISANEISNVEYVGFAGATATGKGTYEEPALKSDQVANAVIADSSTLKDENTSEYYAAFKIEGGTSGANFYINPFVVYSDGIVVYGDESTQTYTLAS